MNILVIDIGGTNIKIWKTGEGDKFKVPSGKKMTPKNLVAEVKSASEDWKFERVSIGYPGDVRHGQPVSEPFNLGDGWVGFDYRKAFGCPVKLVNDAAMQALGSYKKGKMLFLGLGTGPIRTALRGNIVFLHPLSRGDYVIEGAVTFGNGDAYSVTYHVHVVPR